mmetsp:Transcript_1894/g.5916  ORF Transcript_1894/g.5916 Transcript_1894/m.5916 type:complete len:228 (-) Transcript_1894:808-1491(-)
MRTPAAGVRCCAIRYRRPERRPASARRATCFLTYPFSCDHPRPVAAVVATVPRPTRRFRSLPVDLLDVAASRSPHALQRYSVPRRVYHSNVSLEAQVVHHHRTAVVATIPPHRVDDDVSSPLDEPNTQRRPHCRIVQFNISFNKRVRSSLLTSSPPSRAISIKSCAPRSCCTATHPCQLNRPTISGVLHTSIAPRSGCRPSWFCAPATRNVPSILCVWWRSPKSCWH